MDGTVQQITMQNSISNNLRNLISTTVLLITDYAAVLTALISVSQLATLLWERLLSQSMDLSLYPIYSSHTIPVLYLICLSLQGMYDSYIAFWTQLSKLCIASIHGTAIIAVFWLTFQTGVEVLASLALLIPVVLFYLGASRFVVGRLLVYSGLNQRRTLILGAGRTAEIIIRSIAEEPERGYQVVGLLDDQGLKNSETRRFPYFGTFKNAEAAIVTTGVSTVIIAAPGLERSRLIELINRIQPLVRSITIVPDLFEIPVSGVKAEPLFRERTLTFTILNNRNSLRYAGKRIFDLAAAGVITGLLLPILIIIAFMVRLDSPGPILYKGQRIGQNGRLFPCYKFRTMYVNNNDILSQYLDHNAEAKEEWNKFAKLRSFDPRITRVGRLLRRTSMDELPQLWNVIRGDMSLSGPRPYLPSEQWRLGDYLGIIYTVRPGITGLWQVSGRNEVEFEGRLLLDAWYVRNWSFWLDIIILLKTVRIVANGKGAS